MRDLRVIVSNKIATYLSRDGSIVCGNSDYQIVFSFDSEWDAYENKTARFIWNDECRDVLFTGDTVAVPMLSSTKQVKVGVYAGDLQTTTPALIPCELSILCGSETHSDPPEDVYNQLLKKLAGTQAYSVYYYPHETGGSASSLVVADMYIPDGRVPKVGDVVIASDGWLHHITAVSESETLVDVGETSIRGDDGGYYTPSVADNGDGTMTISFTPSLEGMPAVAPVTVTIPEASITVDQALDEVSTNPVQNKVVTEAFDDIRHKISDDIEPNILPTVTTDDNDKILQVVGGVWTAVAPADSSVAAYLDSSIGEILGGEY